MAGLSSDSSSMVLYTALSNLITLGSWKFDCILLAVIPKLSLHKRLYSDDFQMVIDSMDQRLQSEQGGNGNYRPHWYQLLTIPYKATIMQYPKTIGGNDSPFPIPSQHFRYILILLLPEHTQIHAPHTHAHARTKYML